MNNYDLSVLIPARNEQFLFLTVQNVLENKRGRTEVIVVLDGAWAEPGIAAHDDLTIVYLPKAIGQRGATNLACRLSKAKYVMKLDAHCMVDEGFDVKLMADMQDDWTVIPTMYNLHAFDWVCEKCGDRQYQGPSEKHGTCDKCGGKREKEIIFKPRMNRRSYYYRFDKALHFQYWGEYGNREEAQGDLVEILSAQGSCFMLTRNKYWELEICDEKLAGKSGWGQQGVEVACKTWLSGGKLMVNKKTWYSHMFRTQGGDFGFPFPISGSEVDETRKKSREMFQQNNWPKAVHTFEWLLEKFYPIPEWHDQPPKQEVQARRLGGLSREIIFYTDNALKLKYAHMVQKRLKEVGLPIISSSLKPMSHFGTNIHIPRERGMETYFLQIITALEYSKADIVYMCEHDVVYHQSHFDYVPPDDQHFYYNVNFWRIRPEVDSLAVHWDAPQVSGLVAYRKQLLEWYKTKFEKIQREGFDRSYEPGGRDKNIVKIWRSQFPNIDIRHGNNLTKSKWSLNDFRDKSTASGWETSTLQQIPGWSMNLLLSFT